MLRAIQSMQMPSNRSEFGEKIRVLIHRKVTFVVSQVALGTLLLLIKASFLCLQQHHTASVTAPVRGYLQLQLTKSSYREQTLSVVSDVCSVSGEDCVDFLFCCRGVRCVN